MAVHRNTSARSTHRPSLSPHVLNLRATPPRKPTKHFCLACSPECERPKLIQPNGTMLDFTNNVLRLQETQWLHLKTRDSAADISIDPEVMDAAPRPGCLLRPIKPAPWSQFILQKSARTETRLAATLLPRGGHFRPLLRLASQQRHPVEQAASRTAQGSRRGHRHRARHLRCVQVSAALRHHHDGPALRRPQGAH